MASGHVWMEKYRPSSFDDIVLEPLNKKMLQNIIETGYFPHLLFYGPPGTGKTTTIINLVNAYQERLNQKNKELVIHLNASDERGIDIIRSQISQFVNSKTMFVKGMKFVILDEVDYMTTNAQQALKCLLQDFSSNVRFCLICNYISRIDEGLQNDFLRLGFNQLPEKEIIKFLKNVVSSENLNINDKSLESIQKLYKSDIRSMINFIQSNQHIGNDQINIIDNNIWIDLYNKILNKEKLTILSNLINGISRQYNIDKKNIIKDFLNYIIRNYENTNVPEFLSFIENIVHFEDCKNDNYVNYVLVRLLKLLDELN